MTLNINATGAVPVLDASGAAMIAGLRYPARGQCWNMSAAIFGC